MNKVFFAYPVNIDLQKMKMTEHGGDFCVSTNMEDIDGFIKNGHSNSYACGQIMDDFLSIALWGITFKNNNMIGSVDISGDEWSETKTIICNNIIGAILQYP